MPLRTLSDTLPLPEPEGLERWHGEQMALRILDEIKSCGGQLPFDRFMELALYAPEHGYYSGARQKFGEAGDFITAPELTPLFGYCIAHQCAELLPQVGSNAALLEFGAGSGRLAADILSRLYQTGTLPYRYCILELSPHLRHQQQALLRREVPDLFPLVEWIDRLPENFSGVLLANEVLDAMPVSRFRIVGNTIKEQFVTQEQGRLQLVWDEPVTTGLLSNAQRLKAFYQLADGYESEFNMRALGWISALGSCLQRGAALLIDYGYNGQEFYHPDRRRGTLICHYKHRVHQDSLFWPGLQDITSSVDFTALGQTALQSGFDRLAFTSQAHFLIAAGLDQLVSAIDDSGQEKLSTLQAVKRLTMPNEMGERFKVLALGKGISKAPSGFSLRELPC